MLNALSSFEAKTSSFTSNQKCVILEVLQMFHEKLKNLIDSNEGQGVEVAINSEFLLPSLYVENAMRVNPIQKFSGKRALVGVLQTIGVLEATPNNFEAAKDQLDYMSHKSGSDL
jgi:hypothetical protein